MDKSMKLSRENAAHIGKVFLYSAGSAVVGSAIVLLGNLEVDPQYLFLVPLANTLLVTLKEFLSKER